MTIDKELEIYFDWLNEFYSEDFLHNIKKDYNTKTNNNGNLKIEIPRDFKESKLTSKKEK